MLCLVTSLYLQGHVHVMPQMISFKRGDLPSDPGTILLWVLHIGKQGGQSWGPWTRTALAMFA